MKKGKLVIFSAPSGSGKTTVVRHLLETNPSLAFSISATTRSKRTGEIDGKDYYFLNQDEFEEKIKKNEFLENEEVYQGIYYGTLRSEVDRIWSEGKTVIFDVDVVGGLNIKKIYGNQALAIFLRAPSLDMLEQRLKARDTESDNQLQERILKARGELNFEKEFDIALVNNILAHTLSEAESIVNNFLAE
jgi:guanylate kinase